jgi:hypothetical protein
MKTAFTVLLGWILMSPKVHSQALAITRGPYLQMAYVSKSQLNAPYRASITIRWRTNLPVTGRVVYSQEPEYELLGGITGSPIAEEPGPTTEHIIVLTDLKPDHQYRYYIGASNGQILEKSPDHFFKTPPPPGEKKKIKVWVLGDFGFSGATEVGTNRQDSTIAAMKEFMTANNTGPMDMWLWLGDNAYEKGQDNEYQEKIFHKGRGRYDWAFRQTPFYATPGNHDYYDGSFDTLQRNVIRYTKTIHYYSVVNNPTNGEGGGEPSGTEAYYSYDYGNTHWVSLDTYGFEKLGDFREKILSVSSKQYQWLKKDLAKARANPDINWVIVFTHMPPFSGGTHNSDDDGDLVPLRQNLVPLLDSNKVDVVFSGHSHDYQRTRLMRGLSKTSSNFVAAVHNGALGSNAQGSGTFDGSPNSCFYYKTTAAEQNEGIIYVVNGGGGRGEQTYEHYNKDLVARLMHTTKFMGGSVYLEVENKRLTAKFIGANKQVLDQFTIYKDLDSFTVPPTDGTVRAATCECTEEENHAFTHYVDSKSNLLLSIKKNGIDIGKVGIPPFEVKLGGNLGRTNVGAFYQDNYVRSDRTRSFSSNWRVMNRFWTIKPNPELTGNQQVTVRHYYRLVDLSLLNVGGYVPDSISHHNIRFYKVNATTGNMDPQSGLHNGLKSASAYNKPGIWIYETYGGGNIPRQQATPSEFKWRNGLSQKEIFFYPGLADSAPFASGEFVVGRLAGGGGIGAQTYNLSPQGNKVVLNAGSQWRFYAKGGPPADNGRYNWKGGQDTDELNGASDEDQYDTGARWPSGAAPLGYSPGRSDGEKTLIPSCASEAACFVYNGSNSSLPEGCPASPCQTRWTTAYFRHALHLSPENYADSKSIIINYKRDDGIIIYINGKELLPRDPNMPTEPPVYGTFAKNATEHEWVTIVIPNNGTHFRKGRNTIAVELHQNSENSSDTQFDMDIALSPDVLTSPARIAAEKDPNKAVMANTLYPNPTNGILYFSAPLTYETIRITDARGVVVRYLSKPGILNDLDLTGLPSGVLILSNENSGQVSTYKIIKR